VTNFLNVALLWVHSAVQLLFPIHLLADYSYRAVPLITSAASPLAWAAVAALLALLAVSCWQLPRAPLAVFLLWWVALTLLPSSHVIPHHDFWAEHYLYLPLFGFAGLLALLVARVVRALGGNRRRFELVALAIVLLYGARTVIRNRDWRDDLTLWRVTSAEAPHCARAHANYGGALLARQDVAAAEPEFEAALAIEPNHTSALSGMVMIDQAKDRLAARDELLRRLESNPKVSYTTLLSLAGWFLMNKEYAVAIDMTQQIARRGLGDYRLWAIEGWARARRGQLDRACPLFERALRSRPNDRDALAGRRFCRQHASPGSGAGP
jgi:Tfp pilus assembly protein PilF